MDWAAADQARLRAGSARQHRVSGLAWDSHVGRRLGVIVLGLVLARVLGAGAGRHPHIGGARVEHDLELLRGRAHADGAVPLCVRKVVDDNLRGNARGGKRKQSARASRFLGLVQLEQTTTTSSSRQLQRGASELQHAAMRAKHGQRGPVLAGSHGRGQGSVGRPRGKPAASGSCTFCLTLPGAPRRSNTREDCGTSHSGGKNSAAQLLGQAPTGAASEGAPARGSLARQRQRPGCLSRKRSRDDASLTDSLPVRRSVMV